MPDGTRGRGGVSGETGQHAVELDGYDFEESTRLPDRWGNESAHTSMENGKGSVYHRAVISCFARPKRLVLAAAGVTSALGRVLR